MIKINPVCHTLKINSFKKVNPTFKNATDSFVFENKNIDKKPLIQRGIIEKKQNINDFFDEFSALFFNDDRKRELASQLKEGKISFSTNIYSDFKNPYSATRIDLDENKSTAFNLLKLKEPVSKGYGIGINFSKFQNPIDEIKNINSFFKSKENNYNRPPAFIGLLNVDHPMIMDFISLKNNANYSDWCFDLSVVLPDTFFEKLEKNEDITLKDGNKIKAEKIYSNLILSINKKGEPGIIFSNKTDYVCDCCAAKELKSGENLTLGQINVSKFYNQEFDFEALKQSTSVLNSALKMLDDNASIGILGYQELLNKAKIEYGSDEALILLENILKTIKSQNASITLSPTGTTSRILKTTPSMETDLIDYKKQLKTLEIAQKQIDGQISNTIKITQNESEKEIDEIIKMAKQTGLKAITIFKAQ